MQVYGTSKNEYDSNSYNPLMNQCLLKWNNKYKKYKYQYFKLDRRVHFVWFLKWSCPLAL